MTVKELKEKLDLFPDSCIIMIPHPTDPWMITPTYVSQGVNELDGIVFVGDAWEDD